MHDYEKFWQWFANNNEQLTMLGELDEKGQQQLLDEMQRHLEEYCEGLSFEMGEPTPSGRTLTFSAEGDMDLFRYVVELTENAPDLDWWEFVAFKQPKGKDLKVTFDKYHFETKKMYFMQLESEEEPDILGVRVALPNPVKDDDDQLVGVYVTLEAMIGEFDCSTLVGYLDTCPIPDNPAKEGFRPMDDFPEFVEWFKRKRDSK
ncbi:MAG: hypothetical protein IKJ81_08530 [Bacteroidales bacterium]|jgi:hypothetical protein|nr:hypothetical protein [Bacteroidales bacterium]